MCSSQSLTEWTPTLSALQAGFKLSTYAMAWIRNELQRAQNQADLFRCVHVSLKIYVTLSAYVMLWVRIELQRLRTR